MLESAAAVEVLLLLVEDGEGAKCMHSVGVVVTVIEYWLVTEAISDDSAPTREVNVGSFARWLEMLAVAVIPETDSSEDMEATIEVSVASMLLYSEMVLRCFATRLSTQ